MQKVTDAVIAYDVGEQHAAWVDPNGQLWRANSEVINQAADLGAFPLSTTTSADAATVLTVAPGAYPTQVLMKNGAAGNTLDKIDQIDN